MTLGRRVFADEARAEALLGRLSKFGDASFLSGAAAETADRIRAMFLYALRRVGGRDVTIHRTDVDR